MQLHTFEYNEDYICDRLYKILNKKTKYYCRLTFLSQSNEANWAEPAGLLENWS
jgi:hypothetical protein